MNTLVLLTISWSGCLLCSWLMVYVKKTVISLAVKYHCSKVKRSSSIYSTSCLLLGQAYSNDSKCIILLI